MNGEQGENTEERPRKRRRDDIGVEAVSEGEGCKQQQLEEGGEQETVEMEKEEAGKDPEEEKEEEKTASHKAKNKSVPIPVSSTKSTIVEPLADIRGHTSFITFATKLRNPPSMSAQ